MYNIEGLKNLVFHDEIIDLLCGRKKILNSPIDAFSHIPRLNGAKCEGIRRDALVIGIKWVEKKCRKKDVSFWHLHCAGGHDHQVKAFILHYILCTRKSVWLLSKVLKNIAQICNLYV